VSNSNEADIGSAAHDVLLGGEDRVAWLDFDSWRTNASKEAREAARAAGRIPMLLFNSPVVNAMVEEAHRFIDGSVLAGIFERGLPERTLIWREEFGEIKFGNKVGREAMSIWCRARPDWLTNNHDVMLHYKTTTASARAEKWIRGIMASSGYGLSLRFYARGLAALLQPAPATRHVILVQEQEAPYACSLIALTPAKEEIEDHRVRIALEKWATCIATDQWPAYDSRIHYAEPTPWELAEAEEMT
jgi:hypothetical protein